MDRDSYDVVFKPDDQHSAGSSDCTLHSHVLCKPEDCEVARTLATISEGQIKVTIFAANCSLALSVCFGLAALFLHCWGVITGHAVPIPWWWISIMGAPFGGAFALKVRNRVPWQIGKNEDQ